MIGVFEERRSTVKALQLRPETVDELLRWTNGYRLSADRWIPSEGCWRVSTLRWYPPPFLLGPDLLRLIADSFVVGIRTRRGEEIVQRGQWVVQAYGNGGSFDIYHPDVFDDKYVAAQEVPA